MESRDYWEAFYHSGRIGDYLQYACTNEESQWDEAAERREKDARYSDRDGFVGHTYGRIR